MPTRARNFGRSVPGSLDRDAVDRDLALLERLKAVHAFDQCGFSGTRRAAYDHDLALGDIGAAILQHLKVRIPLADVIDRDHRILIAVQRTMAMRRWSLRTNTEAPSDIMK